MRRGTASIRFTILFAVVFFLSGIGLLGLTYLLSGGNVSSIEPVGPLPAQADFAQAQQRIRELRDELAAVHIEQSRQFLTGALVALAVMAVAALILGRLLARRALRPLRLITVATQRISAESLDQRLGVTGPADEVKELADTVDGLLERLEAAFISQRRFVANASHELRTPLATMRARLDVTIAKPTPAATTVALVDQLRPQLDRIDRLLDGFLVLARTQHGPLPDAEQVNIGRLVAEAMHERSGDATRRGLQVTIDVPSAMTVYGNPTLLTRLVGNLVDNAVIHNDDHGWITITGYSSNTEAVLIVQTGGQMLDQRDVDRLAQPFERLGTPRTGSAGLGLSIVAAITAAHHGRTDLVARPGGGLRVSVTLPVRIHEPHTTGLPAAGEKTA